MYDKIFLFSFSQAKYRTMYEENAKEYNELMKEFHKRNPGAKQFIAR